MLPWCFNQCLEILPYCLFSTWVSLLLVCHRYHHCNGGSNLCFIVSTICSFSCPSYFSLDTSIVISHQYLYYLHPLQNCILFCFCCGVVVCSCILLLLLLIVILNLKFLVYQYVHQAMSQSLSTYMYMYAYLNS